MILLDKEVVVELGMDGWTYPFCVEWEVGSPEAVAADYADVLAEGPFLLVVHDEFAWAGQNPDHLMKVAGRRTDPPNRRRWEVLADLYVESMGVSRQSFLLRFASMRRQTQRRPVGLGWMRWENVYHWPDGNDLAWSALVHGDHPWLEVREHDGKRQVKHR